VANERLWTVIKLIDIHYFYGKPLVRCARMAEVGVPLVYLSVSNRIMRCEDPCFEYTYGLVFLSCSKQ
jgi:hypothetical protein